MRYFRHVTILHGCAVGGGSITYACTMLRPPDKVWDSGSWSGLADWKSEMPQHYDTASRMLGVVENRILGPSDKPAETSRRLGGRGRHVSIRHSVAIFQAARRGARRHDRSRPLISAAKVRNARPARPVAAA